MRSRGKVLFIATIDQHILKFHLPYLKWFQENNFETHVASFGNSNIPFCDVKHDVAIQRSPYSIKNITAYKKLKEIISKENFTIIHGHTPMGGVLARLCSIGNRKKGTKVFYTPHGFYFYKGSPLKYWLLYYPVEIFLSRYTDVIITINSEDYELVKSSGFKSKEVYKIDGIGVKSERYKPVTEIEKQGLRHKLGYPTNEFIMIYVAEFIHRKNHKFIIDSAVLLKNKVQSFKIIFAGRGPLIDQMKKYCNAKGLEKYIDFLGFREDIPDLINISDIGISSSKSEGLPIGIVEEMFAGIPVIVSDERGHREVVNHGLNGFIFGQSNSKEFIDYILKFYYDRDLISQLGKNAHSSSQKFSVDASLDKLSTIYMQYI